MKYKKLNPEMAVVHCSATKPSMDIGAKEIDFWHREKGWFSIGYHYVIRRDGTVEKGRPDDIPGAHARGHNHNSLGICLIGGVDDNGKPEDNFTEEQHVSLYEVLFNLVGNYKLHTVLGHRDLPNVNKACPSFDVSEWLAPSAELSTMIYDNAHWRDTHEDQD